MALGPCPRRDPRARHCGCSCVAAWRNHRIITGTYTTSEAGLSRTSSDVRFSAAVRGIAVTPDLSRSDLCVHALPAFALVSPRFKQGDCAIADWLLVDRSRRETQ